MSQPLILISCLLLGYAFYWAFFPVGTTGYSGLSRPYAGHSSYASMRVWGWIKALIVVVPSVIFWPDAKAGYPLRQIAWAAFVGGYVAGHVHWLIVPARWWHARAA